MTHHAVCVWDFTIAAKRCSVDELKKTLKELAKKWCFQLEEGDNTDYLHYQGRFSLKTKLRLKGCAERLGFGAHLSPTSEENAGNEFYVTKEDTRVQGPWSDRDAVIPSQYASEDIDWYPWQRKVIKMISQKPDTRTINCIVDEKGNQGKSLLACWYACRGLAFRIPCLNDINEVLQIVFDKGPVGIYFMDIPRGQDSKAFSNFISAMEELKNGYCYDKRYHFRDRWQEPCHIWLFMNSLPNMKLLSADRWKLWTIRHKKLKVLEDDDVATALDHLISSSSMSS